MPCVILCLGSFCALGHFVHWVVSSLGGRFELGRFGPRVVLGLGFELGLYCDGLCFELGS